MHIEEFDVMFKVRVDMEYLPRWMEQELADEIRDRVRHMIQRELDQTAPSGVEVDPDTVTVTQQSQPTIHTQTPVDMRPGVTPSPWEPASTDPAPRRRWWQRG